MKVAIAGATGFIGRHLLAYYLKQDRIREVIVITRGSKHAHSGGSSSQPDKEGRVRTVTWSELEQSVQPLEGVRALINLAGESINQRWTAAAKERILSSRLTISDQITGIIDRMETKPEVLVNASGISIYGTSETDRYYENCPPRVGDFLSRVVEQWEQAIDRAQGVRIVKLRVGVVLGNDGGAFPKMALPYRLGVGGRIGSGRQWLSWVHIEDMVRLIDHCVKTTSLQGPVNATAPWPARNNEFGRALGKALGRPHYLPVPASLFKLLFGELSVLLLEGQEVIPRELLINGFEFRYSTIDQALAQLVSKQPPSEADPRERK